MMMQWAYLNPTPELIPTRPAQMGEFSEYSQLALSNSSLESCAAAINVTAG